MKHLLRLWAGCAALCLAASPYADPAPTVTIQNGTIVGTRNRHYAQDHFLGIPYAAPPVGPLRFHAPQPLSTPWPTPLNATAYGPYCIGYSVHLAGFSRNGTQTPSAEDCLTINIIRPSTSTPNTTASHPSTGPTLLPILAYIHGGGLSEGGSRDPRYNLSSLVATSVAMRAPIIAVSFNYRLGGWGFLSAPAWANSSSSAADGLTNLGLRDQALALRWLHDNARAFGGDPAKVTLVGESGGAFAVGYHLLSPSAVGSSNSSSGSGGKPLFRAAVAQSGGPFRGQVGGGPALYAAQYAALLAATGCAAPGSGTTAADSAAKEELDCLREAPTEVVDAVFGTQLWLPVRDGATVPRGDALTAGRFARVPLLIGSNTNEGTAVSLLGGLAPNSAADVVALLRRLGVVATAEATVEGLVRAYAGLNLSAELGSVSPSPGPQYGAEFGRASLVVGDLLFSAGRRIAAQTWAENGVEAYSYRFDTVPAGIDPQVLGVAHFQDVAFVFGNSSLSGYDIDPFAVEPEDRRERYIQLSELMSRMWISFVNHLTPNYHGVKSFPQEWPVYSLGDPENIVFDGNNTVHVERDDWRTGASAYIKEHAIEFF